MSVKGEQRNLVIQGNQGAHGRPREEPKNHGYKPKV